MARKTNIQSTLDRAAEGASRQIIKAAIAEMPASTTLRDLHGAMAQSPLGSTFEQMTLADLASALGGAVGSGKPQRRAARTTTKPTTKKATARRSNVNTRTQSGRETLDAAVRELLAANGPSRSEAITPNVPGDTAQVRQSLKRMIESGVVTATGNRRATTYGIKGSGMATPGAVPKKPARAAKKAKKKRAKKATKK